MTPALRLADAAFVQRARLVLAWPPSLRVLLDAGGVAALLFVLVRLSIAANGVDAHSYWSAWRGETLYDAAWHETGSFVYSPAFAQAIGPLAQLPWEAFFFVWTALCLAALAYLAGPMLAGLLALVVFEPFGHALRNGQIDLFIGVALVLALRWPAAWSFVLLTKVTPGIGLLWHVVRGEWRQLAIALGATLGIVAVSLAVAPGLWVDWLRLLVTSPDARVDDGYILVIRAPLIVRLAMAAALVAWGALTDRPWTIVVAAFVASPLATLLRTAMLIAVVPMLRIRPEAR